MVEPILHDVRTAIYCRTCKETVGTCSPTDGEDSLYRRAREHAKEHLYELKRDHLFVVYLEPISQWLATFGPGRGQTAFIVAGPEAS